MKMLDPLLNATPSLNKAVQPSPPPWTYYFNANAKKYRYMLLSISVFVLLFRIFFSYLSVSSLQHCSGSARLLYDGDVKMRDYVITHALKYAAASTGFTSFPTTVDYVERKCVTCFRLPAFPGVDRRLWRWDQRYPPPPWRSHRLW